MNLSAPAFCKHQYKDENILKMRTRSFQVLTCLGIDFRKRKEKEKRKKKVNVNGKFQVFLYNKVRVFQKKTKNGESDKMEHLQAWLSKKAANRPGPFLWNNQPQISIEAHLIIGLLYSPQLVKQVLTPKVLRVAQILCLLYHTQHG